MLSFLSYRTMANSCDLHQVLMLSSERYPIPISCFRCQREYDVNFYIKRLPILLTRRILPVFRNTCFITQTTVLAVFNTKLYCVIKNKLTLRKRGILVNSCWVILSCAIHVLVSLFPTHTHTGNYNLQGEVCRTDTDSHTCIWKIMKTFNK